MSIPDDWVGKRVSLAYPEGVWELVEVSEKGIVIRLDKTFAHDVVRQKQDDIERIWSERGEETPLPIGDLTRLIGEQIEKRGPALTFLPWNMVSFMVLAEDEIEDPTS